MENLGAEELLKKYTTGHCTDQEIAILETWYLKRDLNEVKDLLVDERENDLKEIWENLKIETKFPNRHNVKLWPRISIAAAILLIFMGSLMHLNNKQEHQKKYDISAPKGNKAFLTLANGKRIELNISKNGEIAIQTGVKITKISEGQIEYTISKSSLDNNSIKDYNTIETPNGGQYSIVLPDGTKVWLNSASSIEYPVSFINLGERRVKLNGEAYFQVSKDKNHPFIVQTNQQEVKVLGTHFNINAYGDEQYTITTLEEGAVKIESNGTFAILKPDQQSILQNKKINISNVDSKRATAWKNGDFIFDSDIRTIMRQISRWYDVEVKFEGNIPVEEFYCNVSKFKNISEVLHALELTDRIHFKIEGRRITVMP